MPTSEEIAATASALQSEISTRRSNLGVLLSRDQKAKDLEELAARITAQGVVRIGNIKVTNSATLATIVGALTGRAEGIRRNIVLPAIEPVPEPDPGL
jgi:hypothetical protein